MIGRSGLVYCQCFYIHTHVETQQREECRKCETRREKANLDRCVCFNSEESEIVRRKDFADRVWGFRLEGSLFWSQSRWHASLSRDSGGKTGPLRKHHRMRHWLFSTLIASPSTEPTRPSSFLLRRGFFAASDRMKTTIRMS